MKISRILPDWAEVAIVIAITALCIGMEFLFEPTGTAVHVATGVGIFFTLAVVLWFHRRRGDGWGELGLARPRSWWKTLLLTLPAYVFIVVLASLCQLFVISLLMPDATADISRFAALRGDLPRTVTTIVTIWFTAAFAEEVIYRGFLMGRLSRMFGGGRGAWWASVVVSSVVFGLLHLYQGPAGVAITGVVGALTAIVYLAVKRNLWVAILAHALLDTIALVALYLGATA